MLDTSPAIRFYLSIDNIAGNHPLVANYLLYLNEDDRRRESWNVMNRGIEMTKDVYEMILDDYNADETNDDGSKIKYIENALKDMYADLWGSAIANAKTNNKTANKSYGVEWLDSMRDYDKRILNTFRDYGPRVEALYEALTPNKFWYLDKPIIVPPDCFEPKYTWGFK